MDTWFRPVIEEDRNRRIASAWRTIEDSAASRQARYNALVALKFTQWGLAGGGDAPPTQDILDAIAAVEDEEERR